MESKKGRLAGLRRGVSGTPHPASVPKSIHVFRYTPESVEETDVQFPEDLAAWRKKEGILWVSVDGLGNPDIIREIGRVFELHPLAVEDVLSLRQRPKVDRYEGHLYIVLRDLHGQEPVWAEQVSLFLGEDFLVTFQERPGNRLEAVRDRLRADRGMLRREGADYLAYSVIDEIVDNYFPFLESVGESVESLEDEVVEKPRRTTLAHIHDVRRGLLEVRRAVWPLRDALSSLLREETPLVSEKTRLHLHDCYDHAVLVLDIVETYREVVGGLMDVYISSIDLRMQEIMKVLTVIATIFIPMSFIAGVYGMNFRNIPEIQWSWGYPAALGVMLLIAVAMLIFFRRKGWLGGKNSL